jgi:ABC-2 type transport system permease protein
MMILAIAWKTLKEYFREPALLGFILAGPILLIGLFYVVYTPLKDHMSDFVRMTVVNSDEGPQGAELVASIRGLTFDRQQAVGVTVAAIREEAEIALLEGRTSLVLVIPPDFSRALEQGRQVDSDAPKTALTYEGDSSSLNYQFTKSFIDELVRGFIRSRSGKGEQPPAQFDFLTGTGTSADFDFSIPGLLIFAMSMLIISTAITLVRENVALTLTRLRLSHVRAPTFLAGIGLAQGAISLWMILLGFGTALLLGYGHGSDMLAPGRVFWLVVVSQLFAVTCIGLGMITAAFSRTDGDAANLGSMIMVPLVFLSGILFPLPAIPLFSVGSTTVGLYDLIPATLAAEILRRAVSLGESPTMLAGLIAGLVLENLVIVCIGSWLYQRLRLDRG